MTKKKLRPGALALRNIKQHKKQYAAMAAGIILALIFASGLTYFGFCYKSSINIMQLEKLGGEDKIIMHTEENVVNGAQAQGLIDQTGWAHLLGYLYTTGDKYRKNGATVAWLDDTAKKLANPVLLSGTWPEKEGEIAIEQTAMAQMGLEATAGDKITVQMQLQNGNALLDKTVEKTYVLTGILKNKRSNIASSYDAQVKKDMPAAFVCADTQTEPGGLEGLACYCTLPGNGYVAFNDYILGPNGEENGNGYLISIPELLNFRARTTYGIFNAQPWQVVVLISVLLIAACAAVVNAFNTNLQSRKKQIGLLRAVGATKGQIIKMYGTEVLVIALFCIPVSLLICFFAVRGLIAVMGSDYVFVPNLWVLLLCGVCGLACVMIAALIPLIAATRISPMQAIRNISTTRKMKTKHICTKKEFRLPKLLAARRTTFSKRRQVVVSIFLCIAIIGSGWAFSYSAYQLEHLYQYDFDYQLYASINNHSYNELNVRAEQNGFTESDRQTVLRLPYIESSAGQKTCNVNVHTDAFTDYLNMVLNDTIYDNIDITSGRANELTSENYRSLLWQNKSDTYTQYKAYTKSDYLPVELGAVDSETLEQLAPYLDSGQIDTERIDAGEEVILIAPEEIGFYAESNDSSNTHYYLGRDMNSDVRKNTHSYFATAARDSSLTAGKVLDLTFLFCNYPPEEDSAANTQDEVIDKIDQKTTIGAVLDEIPTKLQQIIPGGNMVLLTSISGMANLAGSIPYSQIDFTLNRPCDDEIDSEVQSVLNEITSRVEGSDSTSNYAFTKLQQDNARNLLTVVLSIVILLFVFCGTIVNNTITADIRENRRELGTLRAVGASAKELSQAYIWQLLRMLGWGSAIGLGGFCLSYLAIWAFCRFKYGPGSMEFVFTPWVSILFCVLLFAVCSLNLYLKIKHETKNSIVDNIRELG